MALVGRCLVWLSYCLAIALLVHGLGWPWILLAKPWLAMASVGRGFVWSLPRLVKAMAGHGFGWLWLCLFMALAGHGVACSWPRSAMALAGQARLTTVLVGGGFFWSSLWFVKH